MKNVLYLFIVALLTTGCTKDEVLEVVSSISLKKNEISIRINEFEKLVVNHTPHSLAAPDYRWESSNDNIASVFDGEVNGVSVGEATIKVTAIKLGLTASCKVIVSPEPHPQEDLIRMYGVENIFYYLDENRKHLFRIKEYESSSTISFSGTLKSSGKFGLILFDSNTKERLCDPIEFEETITVDKGYGIKETLDIIQVLDITNIHSFGDSNNSIIIALKAYGVFYDHYGVQHIYFINDKKVTRVIEPTPDNDYNRYISIKNWGQNAIIRIGKYPLNATLYSPLGETKTEVIYSEYGSLLGAGVLNDFEAIGLNQVYPYDKRSYEIKKIDLREQTPLWSTRISLTAELDRPRIEDPQIIEKTHTHLTYGFSYVEYSGNKGIIMYKVNIENGEVVHLQ